MTSNLIPRRRKRRKAWKVPGAFAQTQPILPPQTAEEIPLPKPRVDSGVYVGANSEGQAVLREHIVKVAGGYRIISHTTGKNLGTYKSKSEAQAALVRMARFREAATSIGACRYVGIGGRQVCTTGGHNHTGRLKEGESRVLYYGGAQPGRRARKRLAIPADVGGAPTGTIGNMSGTSS